MNRASVCAYAKRGGTAVRIRIQETVMRRRIIEALTYPRITVLANLNAEECSQHLLFNLAHEECRYCEQSDECHWLNINDEFSVLMRKPMDLLFESLQFCIDYVDSQCTYANHNTRRCACESCHWVRSARRLTSEYRNVRRSH